ncbi:MAG: DUF1571 domain-containing protein [Planctomycetes bacterium]|nr:DUF1571 domain-containing protein [Planctomycetota bacterium]
MIVGRLLRAGYGTAAAGILMLVSAGCADANIDLTTRPGRIEARKAADIDARADEIRSDPIGFLQRVAEKCAALDQYTLTFTRVERRGLFFKSLRAPEAIACWFRREPYSIRMKWLDDDIKYGESTFVQGQVGNKVRFMPRHGLFGLPPLLTKVHLNTPVIWGEARRPLTEWGLEKLVLETLASIEEVKPRGGALIEYRGIVTLPDRAGRPVHYLHVVYPRDPGVASIQELYFDVTTELPVATILRFSGKEQKLDAAYFYDEIDTDVMLSDDDFVLDAERDERSTAESADSPPAKLSADAAGS